MPLCPCGRNNELEQCCLPYISGKMPAPDAESLMRSRYTAYTLHNADYIYNTTFPTERKYHNKKDILSWAKSCTWIKLEIISASESVVEFKAYYLDSSLKMQVHHERSFFEKQNGSWYFKEGMYP